MSIPMFLCVWVFLTPQKREPTYDTHVTQHHNSTNNSTTTITDSTEHATHITHFDNPKLMLCR